MTEGQTVIVGKLGGRQKPGIIAKTSFFGALGRAEGL